MSRNVSVHSQPLKYVQKICVGPHVFHSDESIDLGGNDAGPNPDELLMTALGACTNITARMYAERKRWPLQGVETTLQYERVHADGNAQPGATNTAVDQIEMMISFAGDLSEEQQQRLLEIANRCPIHRMLVSHVQIRSKLR
jgi:putative redox protein